MKFLPLFQILELHRQIISQSGGSLGIRDIGALESALAQPKMTFDKKELYQTLQESRGFGILSFFKSSICGWQ